MIRKRWTIIASTTIIATMAAVVPFAGTAAAAGGWVARDLTTFTKSAASAPMGYFTRLVGDPFSRARVVYQGVDGHIYELQSFVNHTWSSTDLTNSATGVPELSSGAPFGYSTQYSTQANDYARVVYVGKNDHHIHEISSTWNSVWNDADLSVDSGSHAVAATAPMGFATSGTNSVAHVVFADSNHHVHDLHLGSSGGWIDDDLFGSGDGPFDPPGQIPLATGAPFGFADTAHTAHIVYTDAKGNVIWLNQVADGWGAHKAAGPGLSSPMGYVTNWGGHDIFRVVSTTANNRITETWYDEAVGHDQSADLTARGNGTFAQPHAMGYYTWLNAARVVYTAACPTACPGDVHELFLTPGGNWHDANLTASAGGPPAVSAPFGYETGPLLLEPREARVVYRAINGDVMELEVSLPE